MLQSEEECRITGVAITKVVIEASVDGVKEVGASVALIGEVGGAVMTFGSAPPVRAWPDEVVKAVDELIEVMEEHLIGMVFKEDESGDPRIHAGGDELPPSLVGSDLGTDEEGVEQL